MTMRIKQVSLIRLEGPTDQCDQQINCRTIDDANAVLRNWSKTAPKGGSYDKIEYIIHWIDGTDYVGKYYLRHLDQLQDDGTKIPDLLNAVRQYVGYMARLPELKPESMELEEWYKDCLDENGDTIPGCQADQYFEYYEKYLDPEIKGNGLAENGPWRCPGCDELTTDYPALSRRDNKTDICSDCGTREALEDFKGSGVVALNPGDPENLHKTLMGIFGE